MITVYILAQKGKMAFKTPFVPRELTINQLVFFQISLFWGYLGWWLMLSQVHQRMLFNICMFTQETWANEDYDSVHLFLVRDSRFCFFIQIVPSSTDFFGSNHLKLFLNRIDFWCFRSMCSFPNLIWICLIRLQGCNFSEANFEFCWTALVKLFES